MQNSGFICICAVALISRQVMLLMIMAMSNATFVWSNIKEMSNTSVLEQQGD